MFRGLLDRLDHLNKAAILILAAASMAAICWIDIRTGVRLSLLTFAWAPVALVAWYCGMWYAFVYAAVDVGLIIFRDIQRGQTYSHPFFLVWDALLRSLSFFFFVWVLGKLREAYLREAQTRRLSQEVEQLKSSIISLMSHEIANAISVMKMSVFLIKERQRNPPHSLTEGLDTISRVLVNMDLAARNFLDNARMASGKLSLKLEAVDLAAMLAELMKLYGPLFSQRDLTVILDMPSGGGQVRVDRAALSLILSNLIGNAVKYTAEGGRITIKFADSSVQRDSVQVSVADNGIGISPEGTQKIAAAFVRLPEGKVMAKGFGLGLKMVHDLLELHGSHLDIDSAPGKGSMFSFTLPKQS